MTAAATCTVFGTVELLENIFLQLDLEADTACLCNPLFVSRDFSHTILESPRLRDCLWIAMPMSPYGLGGPIYNRIRPNALLHYGQTASSRSISGLAFRLTSL
jgi:hypothetical protein